MNIDSVVDVALRRVILEEGEFGGKKNSIEALFC